MKKTWIATLLTTLMVLGFSAFHAKEAYADTGHAGIDVSLGLGVQFCTDSRCSTESNMVNAVGGLSAGMVWDLHEMFGVGAFIDLDMGGIYNKHVDSSFSTQLNLMAKAFARLKVVDVFLGLGLGYAHYEVTNSGITAKHDSGSFKLTIGSTYFLPMMPNLGVGVDYNFIHNFGGGIDSPLGRISVNFVDVSHFKFHVRMIF